MDFLLINPPIRLYAKPDTHPFGLAYVARALLDEGHKVTILDINAHRWERSEVLARIDKLKFDLVGIGGLITVYPYVKWLAATLKSRYPHIPIVVGGSVGASIPRLMLERTRVDVVVVGEGEHTAKELLPKLVLGQDLSDVRGIFYRRNGEIVSTPARERIKDLDSIPFPAYELLPMDIYLENNKTDIYFDEYARKNGLDLDNATAIPLISGRGCPFFCTFCYRNFGRETRKHSVDYVINHLRFLQERYQVRRFVFLDELFTVSKKWTIEFCDRVIRERLNIFFYVAGARTNTVDEETLRKLRQAGCYAISYGIETGSQKMLKAMNKTGITVELNKKIVKMSDDIGLMGSHSFIVGMPGESEATIQETVDFAKEVGLRELAIFFATPYPGTQLFEIAKERRLITDEEGFVESLGGADASELRINFTELPDARLKYLTVRADHEVRKAWLRRNRRYWQLFKLHLRYLNVFLTSLRKHGIRASLGKLRYLLK
jgi:radical SAM superfamily enzyme YgiQ (UPF0313 family)